MGPEKLINEFFERMREAAGTNLIAAILNGSVAAGDYVADYSDVNLLYVLRDTSFTSIAVLGPVMQWWGKQKHRPPLLMGTDEMRRSSDVFSIEFLDMRRHYRVLWGEDVLKTLEIPMRLHRAQVEYELREKTIVLRQGLLVAVGSDETKWELLLRSLPAFGTLFRHALIALGDPGTGTKREAAALLKEKTGIDVKVIAQGTGQALDTGRRGDSDVVFVHAKSAEEKFLAEGEGMQGSVPIGVGRTQRGGPFQLEVAVKRHTDVQRILGRDLEGDHRARLLHRDEKSLLHRERIPGIKNGTGLRPGRHGSGKVILRSAPAGTGIIAGGAMRAVFEMVGVHDIVAKSMGSTNPYNVVRATFDALKAQENPRGVAARRNKKVSDIVSRRRDGSSVAEAGADV